MSSAVYYDFKIADASLEKELKSQSIEFDYKKVLKRNIKSVDGDITIVLTGLGTIAAILITTDKAITVKIDSNAVSVTKFIFIDGTLTTLAVACSDATGALVEVTVWGKSS